MKKRFEEKQRKEMNFYVISIRLYIQLWTISSQMTSGNRNVVLLREKKVELQEPAFRVSLPFLLSDNMSYSAFQSFIQKKFCKKYKREHIRHLLLYEFRDSITTTEAFKNICQCLQMQFSLVCISCNLKMTIVICRLSFNLEC